MTPDDPSNLPLATDLNYDRNPTPFPTPVSYTHLTLPTIYSV